MSPLNTTVKLGEEARVFLSSSAQSLLSINLEGIATETGSILAMGWQEVGFLRYPVTYAEPIEIVDIQKRFDIDHTKRGREQRKTGSFVAAWTNTGDRIRRFQTKEMLVKIEWHVEDIGAVDEYEYLKSVRILNLTREAPSGEVVERVDFIFADLGQRPGP